MVLTGLHNVGEVPFHDVFIHPKILDGYGEGMSKIEGQRGRSDRRDREVRGRLAPVRPGLSDHRDARRADAGRVRVPALPEADRADPREPHAADGSSASIAASLFSTQWAEKPEDKALPRGAVVSDRFELARNFCNKLWNASRFALMNLDGFDPGRVADDELLVEDSWILSRLATVTAAGDRRPGRIPLCRRRPGALRFCLGRVLQFLRRDGQGPAARRVGSGWRPSGCLAHTLDTLLRLLHPMIPFLTEDVWQRLGEIAPERGIDAVEPAAESIMLAPWPECDPAPSGRGDRGPIRPLPRSACGRCATSAPGRAWPEDAARVFRPLRRRGGRFAAADGALFRLDGQRPGRRPSGPT